MNDPATARLFWHFLLHLLVAALLFCAVAAVAILLWYATVVMEQYGVPYGIRIVCHYVSEILFGTDVFCLLFFTVVEGWKLVRDIWKSAF